MSNNVELENKKILNEKFDKLSRQYLLQGVLMRKLEQYVEDNKTNEALMNYIRLKENIEECQELVKQAKDELYLEMDKQKEKELSNDFIRVTCKFPYARTSFDTTRYFEENPIDEEVKKKYLTETICKGNVTIKEKVNG